MDTGFTPVHRGGSGSPMVLLHGLTDTWRTWELVLAALEREHDVLAPTLAGHAGGPRIDGKLTATFVAGEVERAMDETGFETAHVVGNSMGGYVALQLAERGRARTVVALAPGGGFDDADRSNTSRREHFTGLRELARAGAPYADAFVASSQGRRRATQYTAVKFDHIPVRLLSHQIRGVAACDGLPALLELADREGFGLDAERITCPVRIVWGQADRVLPWPAAALRYRDSLLPHADWVLLDGVGHCPQLDAPLETAQLILDFTRD